jgi:hypothetical protein
MKADIPPLPATAFYFHLRFIISANIVVIITSAVSIIEKYIIQFKYS